MKKIGIMTMHRVLNYGSFLQAYGLKQTIEELGVQTEFVDYEFEKVLNNELKKKCLLKRIIDNINLITYLKKKKMLNQFKVEYNNALEKFMNVTSKYNIRPNVDKLVIGSDEVFNCMQGFPVGYSRELFGFNYDNIDVISYAGSFGHTKLDELKKYKIDDEITDMFFKFKDISVRDENSFNIIKELTSIEAKIHLDPVLISNFSNIKDINVIYKNYIIVYAYPGRLTIDEEKYIKKFAKRHNKKIISIGFFQRIADYNLIVSPLEVFSYFKMADYVITDTFHGTIFSIKTNTKFCTIIRDSNKNKLIALLKKMKLENRNVKDLNKIENLYNEDINYSETNKIIKNEREKTIKYLKNNIL